MNRLSLSLTIVLLAARAAPVLADPVFPTWGTSIDAKDGGYGGTSSITVTPYFGAAANQWFASSIVFDYGLGSEFVTAIVDYQGNHPAINLTVTAAFLNYDPTNTNGMLLDVFSYPTSDVPPNLTESPVGTTLLQEVTIPTGNDPNLPYSIPLSAGSPNSEAFLITIPAFDPHSGIFPYAYGTFSSDNGLTTASVPEPSTLLITSMAILIGLSMAIKKWFARTAVLIAMGTMAGPVKADMTLTPINFPDAASTTTGGINDQGQVIGLYNSINGGGSFLYDGNGGYSTIGLPFANETDAKAINNAGTIAGYWAYTVRDDHHGFSADGTTVTTFDVLNASDTFATGINNSIQITGFYRNTSGPYNHGFIKDGVTTTTFDVPFTGAYNTTPSGINNQGQIVGDYFDGTGGHGFLKVGSAFTTIDIPGSSDTRPVGINDTDQIVGSYVDSSGDSHGFSYDGTTFTTIDISGMPNTFLTGINNLGQIAGYYDDSNNVDHGFVITNTPEPSTLLIAGVAILTALGYRWRQRRSS